MNIKSKSTNTRNKKRAPRKITPTYLHNSGLYYLQRFSSSTANFKAVMMRKIKKSCLHHTDQDMDECEKMLDTTIETFIKSELLNDDLYMRGTITTLRRQGKSKKLILAKLRSKGLRHDDILKSITQHDQEKSLQSNMIDPELKAALIHARKKRFGPFKRDNAQHSSKDNNNNNDSGDSDAHIKLYKKALGSMARAGFSYQTSVQALSLTKEETAHYLQ